MGLVSFIFEDRLMIVKADFSCFGPVYVFVRPPSIKVTPGLALKTSKIVGDAMNFVCSAVVFNWGRAIGANDLFCAFFGSFFLFFSSSNLALGSKVENATLEFYEKIIEKREGFSLELRHGIIGRG